MNKSYNSSGFPSKVILHDTRHFDSLSVENGAMHVSKALTYTGSQSGIVFLTPSTGKALCIKGITILGNGNTGIVKLLRSSNNNCIYPAYFTAQVKGSPSSAFNLVLLPNEYVILDLVDRGTSETFVGVTYIEYDLNDFLN